MGALTYGDSGITVSFDDRALIAPVKLLRQSDVFFFYAAAIWRRPR